MAGRNDYGVLHSEFLADDRAHRAAELYVERFGVPEAFALAAVVGHHTELGLWAMRETDDGVLQGDGVAALHVATLMPRSACRPVVDVLVEVGLLVRCDAGVAIVGFQAAYASVLGRRAQNRDAAARAREAAAAARAEADARRGARRPKAPRTRPGASAAAPKRDPDEAVLREHGTRVPGIPEPKSAPPTPHVAPTSAPRHADVADQRIGSVRIEENPPTPLADPPDADPRPVPGTPLTPSEHAAARVIASALLVGEVRLPDPPSLDGARRRLVEVERRRLEAARDGSPLRASLDLEAKALTDEITATRRRDRDRLVTGLRAGHGWTRPVVEDLRTSDAPTGPAGARVPLRVACSKAAAEARAASRELSRAERAQGRAAAVPEGAGAA